MQLGVCQTPVLTSLETVREYIDAAASAVPTAMNTPGIPGTPGTPDAASTPGGPTPGLLLFPELFFGGFDYANIALWASRAGELRNIFQECADAHGVALAATLMEPAGESAPSAQGPFNSLYFFAPRQNGIPAGGQRIYSKIHLFPAGEHIHFQPGRPEFSPVTWEGVPIGGCICYDLRFPEIFRTQASAAPDIFVVAGQWPASRVAHWQILLRARAVENQCYVLACNGVGPSSLGILGGHSCLVNPQGDVVFELNSEAGSAWGAYNADAVAQARKLVASRTSPVLEVRPRS
ncbi:MAG: nitrilase-related carbon-nitrogen hydrolase [Desulfovibrio sp.]|uniref:nitrilase-related carbon-nitrogen hydrolase n=1 Tax=Desulfovibrio sp. 7SRBS1 TaxID=3378064 RepID=UPI003B3DFF29